MSNAMASHIGDNPQEQSSTNEKGLYAQSHLNGVAECWKKLKKLEGDAESCYGDEIEEKVSGDKFVKMLLLDGCFIVEFVIRLSDGQHYENDPIDTMIRGIESNIVRDMLLLENQLPFFVLQSLYDMINPGNLEFSETVEIAFRNHISKMNYISVLNTKVNPQEIKHLLQIVHILCQPQNNGQIQQQKACSSSSCCFWKQGQGGSDIESHSLSNGQDRRQFFTCFLSKFWKQPQGQGQGGSDIEPHNLSNGQDRRMNCACFLCMKGEQGGGCDIESHSLSNRQDRRQFFRRYLSKFRKQPQQSDDEVLLCSIRTAGELQEAGVHFKKLGNISKDHNSNETISLFDIKFNNHGGVLEIPSFALFDPTETFFKNLIAYEQHSRGVRPMYFTDYCKFMDDLINTEKDVNLLRLKDVFVNGLGDDKEVTRLFNNLNIGVLYFSNTFYYKDVCTELNRHYKKPWNMLMAKLRRDYFHSPWAGISTFAAILLLSLTIAQTVLSWLDLHK